MKKVKLVLTTNHSLLASYNTEQIMAISQNLFSDHLPSPSYKIFIPDDTGSVTCCRSHAGQNHIAKLQLCRNHTHFLQIYTPDCVYARMT